MDFKEKLQNYAKLIVRKGINIQEDQPVRIVCPLERVDFARLLAEESYRAGASEVIIDWTDDSLTRLKYQHAPMRVFEDYPQWQVDKLQYYYDRNISTISVSATDPELFQGIDGEKVRASNKASSLATKPIRKYTMNDICSWCVVSAPTGNWARRVFPDLEEEEAVARLWEEIFYATRADREDPIGAWEDHINKLNKYAQLLNEAQFDSLHYSNSLGTDLRVELPKNHIWLSAVSENDRGTEFIANIPTEEVYTLPRRQGVNGSLFSSKPFNYNGNLIDKMSFTFKDGKVIEYKAEIGEEHLDTMFSIDENARYLGEVALVAYDSPISNQDILFMNTLYDENASCHFAFGKAYPTNIKDGEKMTDQELLDLGVNDSLIHEDFMVGSQDLKIVGRKASGEEVLVFENGNWAI